MKKLTVIYISILLIIMSSCSAKGGLSKNDFIFSIDSKKFELDSNVTALLDELGTEYEFSEGPSCVYNGTDKYYSYKDVDIYTYPIDDADLIDEIVLTSSKYSTNRGIKTGDSFGDVKKAYGEDYREDGDMVTYSLDPDDPHSRTLYFMIENGIVTSIHYYSASNIIS
jgi:hypothetical protein